MILENVVSHMKTNGHTCFTSLCLYCLRVRLKNLSHKKKCIKNKFPHGWRMDLGRQGSHQPTHRCIYMHACELATESDQSHRYFLLIWRQITGAMHYSNIEFTAQVRCHPIPSHSTWKKILRIFSSKAQDQVIRIFKI